MERGLIVLISDRPDRSRPLADAIRTVAECRLVDPVEALDRVWASASSKTGPILGVIADIDPLRAEARRCLGRLAGDEAALLTVLLTRGSTVSPLAARELGAGLCLPARTEPDAVVDALLRQVRPDLSPGDLLVRRAVARSGILMDALFRAAVSGPVDMAGVERSLDPVLDAIGGGGLTRWLAEVWTLDDATFQHCLLVAGFAAAFAQSLGFSTADRHLMTRAALVHDLGKARIPLAILDKPGPLDEAEIAVMRTHAAIGHDILTASGGCDPMTLAMTRHHHEMLDGSGYPDGLRGAEIADPIRLLTICDIYSALIERRAYKDPIPSGEALAMLAGMTGKLDRGLVHAFALAVHGTP